MTLRNVILWIVWILVLALAIKLAAWAYENFWPDPPAETAQEVLDTGQCFCRHRWTEERLSVPYRQCVDLARRR